MQHELTTQIASLFEAAARPATRKLLKPRLLEIANLAQVVPEQKFLLRAVAKSMTDTVEKAFGPLCPILVLTEPGRRQVYFSVLARLADARSRHVEEADHSGRCKLLEQFLLNSNEQLIFEAYGHCPPGFVRILTRLGDTARQPQVYAAIFDILNRGPFLASALSTLPPQALTDDLFELLVALPTTQLAMQLARRFENVRVFQRFMRVYGLITGAGALRDEHIARICDGETPTRFLERLHHALPFPPSAVSMPGLRHLSCGEELLAASREFDNCLRNYVAEAIRGERQYYVWQRCDAPAVVLSLAADPPFGWCLSECKLAGNRHVPNHLLRELESSLESRGIRVTGTLEEMMRHFPSAAEEAEMEELFAEFEDGLAAA